MKLLRVGKKGKEKPAVLDKNNKTRDLSPDYLNFWNNNLIYNLQNMIGIFTYAPFSYKIICSCRIILFS